MRDCVYTLHTRRYTTFNIMLLFVFLLFICRFEYCYSNNVGCFEGERIALLQFKESLIDKSNRLSSWIGLDCCEWGGVSCSPKTGHVSKLDFRNTFYVENWSSYSNNCLGGEINPSLVNLTHLDYLDLSLNNFSGIQIPEFLGSFKNLKYLNLSSSGFVGNIPPHLGNLSSLQYLHLGDASYIYRASIRNYLSTDNLDWLASLSSLKSLDMSSIIIRCSEDWLCTINKLVSLSSLNLARCNLNTTSPLSHVNSTTSLVSLILEGNGFDSANLLWLSNFTRLEHLNLVFNQFNSSVQDIFEHLASLKFLDLSGNNFKGTLIPLCKLHNLVDLELGENDFQGLIPDCLGNLTSLTSLSLQDNSFIGSIPNSISRLCRLQVLDLAYNNFIGQFPNQLYKCKNLKLLSLSSNSFSGPIANSLGNMSMLQVLRIDNNTFSGSIFSCLVELSNLEDLDISNNFFTGMIPSSLGELSNLEDLDISNNFFTGILSESHFSKLSKLRYLRMLRNLFVLNVTSAWVPPFQLFDIAMDSIKIGPYIPHWLRTQGEVSYITISNASISLDAIPYWFWNMLYNASYIDLSNNHISELPMKLHIEGYVKGSVEYLFLSNNHLTGGIPKWLCNLKELEILDLSTNKLSGEIPPCLGKLQYLVVLNLANNNLYGRIPNSLGSLQWLSSLHLQNNKLKGKLPSNLQNLRSLIVLDLSENELMDIMAPWIGEKLSSLRFLVFNTNKFYGDIPLQLCQLHGLQLLDLASNNISGYIPQCFDNLTGMVSDSYLPYNEYEFGPGRKYVAEISEAIKGLRLQYTTTIPFLRSLDLSGNHLVGKIPVEVTSLSALENLNLSGNHLSGPIPETVGNLSKIESLDLSRNVLSGAIPPSLSSLTFLSYLNLSFNNLSGRIPKGSQLQTFNDPSIYIGNGLCGAPLLKSCPGNELPSVDQPIKTSRDDHEFFMWFYAGMGPGFFVGFIGVLSILLFKRSWRYAYFKFLEIAYNKILRNIFIEG